MQLKQFNQAFEFEFVPPVIGLQNREDPSQNISAIGASASVAGQPTIINNH